MRTSVPLVGASLAAGAAAGALHRETPKVPAFVLDYAPIVALDKGEVLFPADIGRQLFNTVPQVNFTKIRGEEHVLTLDNLNELNKFGNDSVFLTAKEDITNIAREPSWVHGVKPNGHGETVGAVSCAVVLRHHPDDSSVVDAFYFYFYAFNNGGHVLGIPEDFHVGDWEHSMVRFCNGVPSQIFLSQHEGGEAFSYDALEKIGKRALIFSAFGGHANYATAGSHNIPFTLPPLPAINLSSVSIPGVPSSVLSNLNLSAILEAVLPANLLQDKTSMGTLWDPVANAYAYNYTLDFDPNRSAEENNKFTPLATKSHPNPPVGWLTYFGQWGDKQYPLTDPRQFEIVNIPELAYITDGPNGPVFKNLVRSTVCPPQMVNCTIKTSLDQARSLV
ncbi:vacuolar sorting-associated 62 [Trichoderma arundinaceum]|uniref:Vacuolar sorting-associated 62 n=1 Tax=Trichoderma arundinaceum TaxID=490622 RepID=A0A395NM38_TRIAR|nr:vacuolar sorting-associated 62 [Trichoderma arundinaceum]